MNINKAYAEALRQKLQAKGKTGIKFPIKERDAEKYLTNYKYLLTSNLISKENYKKLVDDVNSRSLEDELYNDFCDYLSKNKTGLTLSINI